MGFRNSTQTVDSVFLFIVAISVALLAGVVITMLWFVVKYRRSKNPKPEDIEGNLLLEVVWVVIPLFIVLAMFFYGWKGFRFMRTAPPNSMPVKAVGSMWKWHFEYENKRTSDELVVPSGRPVRLAISSTDVLHSLFIPAFRVKEDAVPGMETHLWFLPDAVGEYDLYCSEYCGTGHSSMTAKVKVVSASDFDRWYAAREAAAGEAEEGGRELLEKKGCLICHSLDGSRKIGPTFKGLFGRKVTVVTAGKEHEVIPDEEYLKRSVMDPQADIVKGYPPVMPPQKDNVTPKELEEIIEYIRELK